MEPNPLAALAPPPEELKNNVAHGRGTVSVVGLLRRLVHLTRDRRDTADPGVVAPDVARSARSHAVAPSI